MKQDPSTTSYYTEPQIYSFDAWGRRRNYTDWSDYTVSTAFLFDRGYTGHEHLDAFELINMNGRVYDPIIARFLSPDPFIQAPDNTQSFNRYSYCFNNPLVYTDPSGEFIGTIWTAGIDLLKTISTKGGLEFWNWNGGNSYVAQAWKAFDPTARWSKTNMAFKIDAGMFKSDPDLKWYQQIWQVASRITIWEAPQSILGNFNAHIQNIRGNVESVNYFYGSTVLDMKNERLYNGHNISTGQNIGNYIKVIDYEGIRYNYERNMTWSSQILLHEYGHYQQSRKYGFLGYSLGGINSAFHPHEYTDEKAKFERDASNQGYYYFKNKGVSIQGYNDVWDEQSIPMLRNIGLVTSYWFVINKIFY